MKKSWSKPGRGNESTRGFAFAPKGFEKDGGAPDEGRGPGQADEPQGDQGLFRTLPLFLCGEKMKGGCWRLDFSF
jgi:hypothetical protein